MIRRDLVEQIRQHGCIADAAACDLPFRQHLADAPVGQWMARISSVSSSIPMWILRHRRRFGPPTARQHMLACVRGMLTGIPFHSPSPSALMPVLSTARQLLLAATRGDQKVQWPCGALVRNGNRQRSLTAT
jgi:hypothetical protein